jgi:hypothetical protein
VSKRHSKADATRIIKRIARNGIVSPTIHAGERMNQRNISMQDILFAIRNGKVIKEPKFDGDAKQWKYKFVGNGIDVKSLTIIINIYDKQERIVIVTVY